MLDRETCDHIPKELLPYVAEFFFPTGARLRLMTDRNSDLEGWVVDIGFGSYLYADGSCGPNARYRAYQELGHERGEDDLSTDDQWKELYQTQKKFAELMMMSLQTAYEVAREHGYANRATYKGEKAIYRQDGSEVTVIDPGQDPKQEPIVPGNFVLVKLADGSDKLVKLSELILADAAAK